MTDTGSRPASLGSPDAPENGSNVGLDDVAKARYEFERGLSNYEFRPLGDRSGVQVSQQGQALRLSWDAVLDLATALLEAHRHHRIDLTVETMDAVIR